MSLLVSASSPMEQECGFSPKHFILTGLPQETA